MGQYEFPNPEWAEVSQEGERAKSKHDGGVLVDRSTATSRLDERHTRLRRTQYSGT